MAWKLDTVVVTTDFSSYADVALKRAVELPLEARAKVLLVHALPLEIPAGFAARVEKGAHAQLKEAVAGFKRLLRESGHRQVEVQGVLTRGPIADALAAICEESGADLVIAGRHGARSFGEQLVGTTVERLVRLCETPALVVSGKRKGPYRRPLAAIDLTEGSRKALELMMHVAPSAPAYRILHAFDHGYELVLRQMNATATRLKGYRDEQRGLALEKLRAFVEPYAPLSERFAIVLDEDEPRSALVKTINRERVDLVAVGTTARTGIGRLLVGSTAITVLRHAPCDVLIARSAPQKKKGAK